MSADLDTLAKEMIIAARGAVAQRWPAVRELAELELRRFAQVLLDIEGLLREGKIDQERAQRLVHIHQISVRSVLNSVEGIGLLTAEQVTQIAGRAVSVVVNRLVGFKLL